MFVHVYRALIDAHSYWRWAVLLATVVALVRSVSAWRAGRAWSAGDERWAKLFLAAVDLQLTFGVILWLGFSPYWKALMMHPHQAMKNHVVRFWSVEHEALMILAVAVAHIGRARSKRQDAVARPRTFALTLMVFLVLVALVFPWPGLPYGRLLFRSP